MDLALLYRSLNSDFISLKHARVFALLVVGVDFCFESSLPWCFGYPLTHNLGLRVRERELTGLWKSNLSENELASATFGDKRGGVKETVS